MADDQVVTNIVARADFSDLIANVRKVTTSLAAMQQQIGSSNKVLSSQINAVNRSFGETLRSTGQFSSHFVSLANDVDVFGKRLDGGKLKLRDYFSTLQTHTRTSGGLIRDLARQQVQLQNAILQPLGRNAQGLMQFNVHVPQGLDEIKNKGAIARQEMQILNKVMQEGAGQLINWGKNTQWAGRQLTVGLTVPIAAFGAAAAKAFREADQELTRLTKVYGGLSATSSTELQKVRRDVTAVANELARGYGASFKETLALSADIAATGKQGSELLGSIRETTRLAVLGEVDRQDAMKATLAIQSAFKQDTDELAQSINFLNAVENQTSTTLNDLVEAIPKAGPVIKGLGGDVQDLALYLTAMREGGINASEGANALKSALASLINPTDVAVKKFEGFGIDLMGIVNNNAGDITKTLFALQAALDNLNPLQKSQAIEQLFGKFQFARLSALFENLGKQGSQTLQVMDLMKASSKELATIASRELSMVTESASGKYKRAVEGLKADLAGIGEEFLKVSTFFINLVDGIVKFVNNLPGPIKTILTFLAGLTAVTGPLIMLTGVLANFLGYVIKGAFHLKALFKGGEGWRMLTPEILAANQAGSLIEKTFYSDAKAALALAEALQVLSAGMTSIQSKMTQGVVSVQPMLSTVAGSIIKPPGDDGGGGGGGGGGIPRIVDPRNPLVGPAGTRASAHMVPRSGMTQEERAAQTIHSFLPAPIPVNQAVGANPQIFASGDLPAVPGLTTITGKSGAVSTGVVSSEAAKWHTMVGTLSMMTKTEVAQMRTQLRTTGTVSSEFTQAFGSLLPQMTSIAENAAQQSAIIVAEAKAGTISVQTARQRIIALNIQVEQLMAQATMGTAASLGRTAVITAVPTLDQPVVDPKTGKSNMRELFKKGKTRSFVDDLARLMGVRTWGAGYSTHTTIPIRRNMGGKVYNPEVHGNVVPGDTSINYDNTPAVLREGGFILNQSSSRANPDLVKLAKNSKNAGGKIVPAILTPGETYFPPEIAQEIMPTLEKANSGSVVKLLNAGGILGGRVSNKKLNYGIRISPVDILSKLGRWNPNMARGARRVYETRASGSRASNSPRTFDPGSQFGPETYHSLFRRSSATWGVHGGALRHGERDTDEVLGHVITSKFLRQFRGLPEQGSSRVLTGSQFESRFGSMPGGATPSKVYQVLPDNLITITKDFNAALINGSATGAMWLSSSRQPQHFISLLSHLLNSGVPYKVAYRTAGRTLDRINKAMYRLKDTNLTETKWGNIVDSSMQAEIAALSRSYTKGSMHSLNAGGTVPGGMVSRNRFGYGIPALSAAVIARLTSKWRKPAPFAPPVQKHDWTNTDPLHGPLFIGKADIGSDGVRRSLSYSIPSGRIIQGREGKQLVGISPMFSNDPRYLIERYMQGDKAVMARMQYEAKSGLNSHPLSIQSLFKSVARRFRGTLYRGMTSQSIADTFPKHIVEAIEKARATGDFSALIGREFIMRRASFTANREIASFFAPGRSSGPMSSLLMEARLFGRRVTPTSKMFPDMKFEAPYGQNWSTRRSPLRRKSEEESLVGGKFTIVGFDGKKLIVEGRAMGGPVSGGTPYVVGERGPELFVPKNSGGIIPSYALGGIVKGGKINYGAVPSGNPVADLITQSLSMPTLDSQMRAGSVDLSAYGLGSGGLPPLQTPQSLETPKGPRGLGALRMLGSLGGGTLGSMVGTQLTGGSMVGNILGFMGGSALADAGITSITNKVLGLGNAAGAAAGKTSLLTKAFNFFIKLPGPLKLLAAIVGVGVAIETINNKISEHRRIVTSGFGISEESAKKLGLQYKKLGSEIDTYQQKYDLMLAKAAANRFNQTKAEGKGINITVPELEKLKKQVAKDFPDEIKMFDKATNEEAIERATNLKAGMVAAGKSVEEANEIILAMIMNSNKSAYALDILGDRGFGKIQGKISATNSTIKTFSNIIKEGNFDQLPIALQTSVNALDNLQQSFIKIDVNMKKAVTSSQAYEKVLNQISGTANKQIGEKGLEEILAQNEGLRDVIDSTDTLAGIWAKIKLSTSGITFNLKDMSSETATAISLLLEQQKDYLRSNDALIGSAADLIAKTGNITANQLIKNANKTKESIEKEIELRRKNIQRIKDEADAKKKALDEETEAEDFLLQIQKKQIEYSEALASGDMARAAQAQLDIQSMTGARQLDLAKTAIDDKADKDIKKQQDLIDNLTKALDGLSKTLEKQISAAGNEQAKKADMQGLYDLFMQAVTLGMGGVTDSEKLIIGDIAKTLRDSGIKEFVDLADKYLKMSPTGNYVGSMQPMGFGALESLGAASFSVIAGKLQVEDTELSKYIKALATGKTGDSTTQFTPKATTEKSAMGTKTVYTITPNQYVNSGMYVEGENPITKKKTFLDYLGRRFQIVGQQEDGDFIVERKFAMGGIIKNFMPGGNVKGPGTGTSDSIPAMLSNGEYVIRAKSVQKYGTQTFDALNAGRFADGGIVQDPNKVYLPDGSEARKMSREERDANYRASRERFLASRKKYKETPLPELSAIEWVRKSGAILPYANGGPVNASALITPSVPYYMASGGMAKSTNERLPGPMAPGTTAASVSPVWNFLSKAMGYVGAIPRDIVTGAITGGKYMAGAATGNPNWMDPKDEKMYLQALRDKENGQYLKAYGSVYGRLATSAIDVFPKLINWNAVWKKAGLKDLPGQTEYFLAQLPGELITDLFKQLMPGNYHDGGPVGHQHGISSPTFDPLSETLNAISNISSATKIPVPFNPVEFGSKEKINSVVGGNDQDSDTVEMYLEEFTENERKVADFMHSWTSLLNTYYGAKYQNAFKLLKQPSLLEKPIVTDLEIAGSRSWGSLLGGVLSKGGLTASGFGFATQDRQDMLGKLIYMQPVTGVAAKRELILPSDEGFRNRLTLTPEMMQEKPDFKKYSAFMASKILTDDSYKMSVLALLNHEFGHALQMRFNQSGITDKSTINSKLFKDYKGKPLSRKPKTWDPFGNMGEMNADMLSGSIMSEMYNAGYMNNLVKPESVTKYLKAAYSKYGVDLSKTKTDIGQYELTDGSMNIHAMDSKYRFSAYLQGFKEKSTDAALSDFLGISIGDLYADPKKAKAVVAELSNYKLISDHFDYENQTSMPDLLNTTYAKILGLPVLGSQPVPPASGNQPPPPITGNKPIPHKALEIQTPRDFARALITAYGGTPTEPLIQGIQAWSMQEGGHWQNRALHNPLNTTLVLPGSTRMNKVNPKTGTGVQAYTSWNQGMEATMKTLSFPNHGYEDIIAALRDSDAKDASDLFKAINKSDWGYPKYNFDIKSKNTQAMMKYNPSKPFGKDTPNPEWYSELPEDRIPIIIKTPEDEGGCVGLDCSGPEEDWKPKIDWYEGDESPWKPKIDWRRFWPEGEKFYNPKQRPIDYLYYTQPMRKIKEFTGTLKNAANSITREQTRYAESMLYPNTAYNIFGWGGKKWAKNANNSGEFFELNDPPTSGVDIPQYDPYGRQRIYTVPDANTLNVIDRPYGEQLYYWPSGGIGPSPKINPVWPGPASNIYSPEYSTERFHNKLEKFFLTSDRETGYKNGSFTPADIKRAKKWRVQDYPDSLLQKFADGGLATSLSIPKFEKGINMVPANMLAMLHKNEAVVPANMNPFNPNAQSYSQPSISYNIAPVINAAPGMDEQAIANMATRQVLAEIKAIDSRNTASIGRQGMRVVGNK